AACDPNGTSRAACVISSARRACASADSIVPTVMTSRSARCPNCGAPIEFKWSSSVQTVCEYCRSVVVRTDVDLKAVGSVADLPADGSPIHLATEGRHGDEPFVVAGRIIYQYEQGNWNEWR